MALHIAASLLEQGRCAHVLIRRRTRRGGYHRAGGPPAGTATANPLDRRGEVLRTWFPGWARHRLLAIPRRQPMMTVGWRRSGSRCLWTAVRTRTLARPWVRRRSCALSPSDCRPWRFAAPALPDCRGPRSPHCWVCRNRRRTVDTVGVLRPGTENERPAHGVAEDVVPVPVSPRERWAQRGCVRWTRLSPSRSLRRSRSASPGHRARRLGHVAWVYGGGTMRRTGERGAPSEPRSSSG